MLIHTLVYSGVVRKMMSITGPEVFSRAHFGSGEGDLYLENVQCDGSESRLEDCLVSGVQCSHSEAAGVSCQGNVVTFLALMFCGHCFVLVLTEFACPTHSCHFCIYNTMCH